MKLSYNWLSEYIQFIPEKDKLSEILTNLGLEVEGYEKFSTIPGNLDGLLVGFTLEVIPHPNADRLRICKVDIGIEKPLSIVCGAPNVDSGQKVIVAPVGVRVFPVSGEPFMINKSKIRGEVSEGMLCAEDEVGLGISHDGIKILPAEWEIGRPLIEYIKPYEDYIFEIGITPNRSDALSHFGAARDVIAFLRSSHVLTRIKITKSTFSIPISRSEKSIQIKIENPENCYRLSGVGIKGIQVMESPDWLKNRLKSIGIRPINNVVDITNFIIQDKGQPLHAYDVSKLKDSILIARNARLGEKIITLDGQTRELSTEDLVMSDSHKPLGIAGVFGGQNSGITENTSSIFLESACFNPVSIRKTSKRFNLKTDASFRFERGTDPEGTLNALFQAAKMVLELAGGELDTDFLDIYPKPIERPQVELRRNKLFGLIGQFIDPLEVEDILHHLGMVILFKSEDFWNLEIPLYKTDVTREVDVIEEVLRVYGFNQIQIPDQIRSSINPSIKPDPEKIQEVMSDFLSNQGFYEIQTNSLVNSALLDVLKPENETEPILVLHPLSQDTNMLRTHLLPSFLRALEYNINRKSNDIQFYEFGKVYFKKGSEYLEKSQLGLVWSGRKAPESWINTGENLVSLYSLKGLIQSFFSKLGLLVNLQEIENNIYYSECLGVFFQNQILGHFGKLNTSVLKSLNIEKETFYSVLEWDSILALKKIEPFMAQEIPKFPGVQRDLSLVIKRETRFDDLKTIVNKAKISILKEILLFDVYEGKRIPEGKKSYSLRFYLQDENQTLTDKDIDKAMKTLIGLFQKEVGAEIPVTA